MKKTKKRDQMRPNWTELDETRKIGRPTGPNHHEQAQPRPNQTKKDRTRQSGNKSEIEQTDQLDQT